MSSYKPETIANVINKLNETYFLPAIQREYVWTPEQIITLMDSIMRGYPINSFLFWKLDKKHYDNWSMYEFIQQFDVQDPHNKQKTNTGHLPDGINLILDGQQRLTSLFIALKGSYSYKKKGRATAKKHTLYLNLLWDGEKIADSEDVETDVTYDFQFFNDADVKPSGEWFRVSEILSFSDDNAFLLFVERKAEELQNIPLESKLIFKKNLQRLFNVIQRDEVITYYTDSQPDLDRVLDIFARTNMGGTKLSKSDLLLSMVTAKWQGVNAREEIHNFMDELNSGLARNNDFDKDFILKTCLMLTNQSVKYRIANFTNENLELFRTNWDEIKTAIRRTVELINSFGIDKDTLTSANAIIPIVYYVWCNSKSKFAGSTGEFENKNAVRIRRWLIMALINRVFSGQSDNVLTKLREVLRQLKAGDDFPVEKLNQSLGELKRVTEIDIDGILDIRYSDKEAFLALSLLYDNTDWSAGKLHKDHIFPRDEVENSKNLIAAGIDVSDVESYQQLCHRLGNLELLTDNENREKKAEKFVDWVKKRKSEFRNQHHIPKDDKLLTVDNFKKFVTAREDLIRERLAKLFAT
jgi:uncharacterized protein with ParB-like and HNH nuclease domain